MVNYRPGEPKIVSDHLVLQISSGFIRKELAEQVALSTAADGMIDSDDNLIYQVPSTKSFALKTVKIWVDSSTTGGTLTISQGDTENAETASKTVLLVPTKINSEVNYAVSEIFSPSKFITIKASAASVAFVTMYGHEF